MATPGRGMVSIPSWKNAIPKISRVLTAGPKTFADALGRALGVPSMTPVDASHEHAHRKRAKQLAQAIDELGHGPSAAVALVDACNTALLEVDDEHPDDSRSATTVVCDLVFEWLPRRGDDGTRVEQIDRSSIEGACNDLSFSSADQLTTEIRVAGVDGRTLGIVRKPGANGFYYELTHRLPLLSTLRSEMAESSDAVTLVADDIAAQVPQLDENATEEDLRVLVGQQMQVERKTRKGRYLVNEEAVLSDDEQKGLKAIYPALRIVNLTGGTPAQEAYVVKMLEHFVKRPQNT